MKKFTSFALVTILMPFLLAGCASKNSAANTPTQVKDPSTITVAWLPNGSGQNNQAFRTAFDTVISNATGLKVEDKLTTDYNIAISALETGSAQLGSFGPDEYLVSHAKDPKVVPLVVPSGNSGTLKDAAYSSRFLVKEGNQDQYKSGSNYSLNNIAGKRIAFVSASSTSGFQVPSVAILDYFNKQNKWKNLTDDDLEQGGNGQFFSQAIFAGSHQLALYDLLMDKVDVACVDDVDVDSYLTLTSGKANAAGSVYTIKKGAESPFDKLAGAQFVVIKALQVQNTPIEANSAFLSQKTLAAITKALTSEQVAKNTTIFPPATYSGEACVQGDRYLKINDAWYNPMRILLGIK